MLAAVPKIFSIAMLIFKQYSVDIIRQ